MYIPRLISTQVAAALKALPVVVLTGPRQAGKTTLLKFDERFKSRRYVSLDDLNSLNRARSDPDALIAGDDDMIIDEAQRAPEIFPAIKRSVDGNRRNGRFLLSGSANLLLMRSISESLAGRAVYMGMGTLTWSELERSAEDLPLLIRILNEERPERVLSSLKQARRNPEESDWHAGGFPPARLSDDYEAWRYWFTGYEQTYLERDLRDLSAVSDLGLFQRLVHLTALRTAQVLNMRELGRDSGTNSVTVARWLSLLETGFMVMRIPPWYSNSTKRLVKTPKIYVCDSGLACFLCGLFAPESLQHSALRGAIAETYAFQNINALVNAFGPEIRISHFRSHAGYECDFVLETHRGLVAVEVKAGTQVSPRDLKGVEALLSLERRCKAGLVCYQGDTVLRLGDRMWAVPAGFLL
ncbi:MAG: ATP-binding protein [Desulfobacteraceae bacterium]|nr:MAG: ATP-binding protein [Desulfobacteraceae bacterium]